MPLDKITSLIGFAVKAGRITLGYDRITQSRSKKYLIIAAKEINSTAKKRLKKYADENGVPILVTSMDLSAITGFSKCKALAFTDKQMSQAALQNINDNYELIVSEEN